MKNAFISILLAGFIILGILWIFNNRKTDVKEKPTIEPSAVISSNGIHWHPRITIYKNGIEENIPANIGIGIEYSSTPTYDKGMHMTAVHTHEGDGTIHLEFGGTVTGDDVRLGNFFKIWGKDFMEFGEKVTMKINGVENLLLGDYQMADGDKIELRYE